jgi:hypothetical protein
MNAQELRIGNWVRLGKSNKWSDKYSGEYVQVTADCFGTSECGARWIDDYSPIPLTPEILEMAGFVKETMNRYAITISNSRYFVWFQLCTISLQKEYEYSGFTTLVSGIQHLYQLQNLIFALTGTELNIKL